MQIDAFNTTTEAVEEDRVGKKLLVSGVYQGTIKLAYLESVGSAGSKKLIVLLDVEDTEIKDSEIVLNSSGTNLCKDGKKLLPGFLKMNAMCVCATGAELGKQAFEEKDIEIWENREKKVAKRMVAVTLLGKQVLVGIQNAICSTSQKQGDTWVNTDKTYTTNLVDKYFGLNGKTHKEIVTNAEPVYIDTWKEKFEGREGINKVPANVKPYIANTPAGNLGGNGKPATSIFSKKS